MGGSARRKIERVVRDAAANKRLLKRAVVGGLAAIVVLNALALVLNQFGGARPGPASSSYTTSPEGLAAYADLLDRFGHPVVRLRQELSEATPPSGSTVMLLDPGSISASEGRRLESFVEAGGHLVAGGSLGSDEPWLDTLVESTPEWSAAGAASVRPLVPAPEVEEVTEVRTSSLGTWSHTGSTLPLLGSPGGIVATVASRGRGRVVLLADASPLHNRLLDQADNAAFALGLAGGRGRPVAFVESVHGYGEQSGLSAIPARWKWALAGLVLAALVFMVARGRRFGPPDATERELPPARSEYVEALAGILARAQDPAGVAARLRDSLRRSVRERAGLPEDAPTGDIEEWSRRFGFDDEETRSIAGPGHAETDLLVLGRALARFTNKGEPGKVEETAGL